MPQVFNHEAFLEYFSYSLRPTEWWLAFSHAALVLSRKPKATILEIGRYKHISEEDWQLTGRSTEVWNWIAKESDGLITAISVDDDPKGFNRAKEQYARVDHHLDDISTWLGRNKKIIPTVDLLYLNYRKSTARVSDLQNATYLAEVMPKLPSGCLVIVDKPRSVTVGKLFEASGVKPEVSGPVMVWRKK